MKNLTEYSDTELVVELKRRKDARRTSKRTPPPQLPNPQFIKIEGACHDIIINCANDGFMPKTWENDIAELVLETLYGSEIWTWIDERIKMK